MNTPNPGDVAASPEVQKQFEELATELRPCLVRVARRLNTGDLAEDAVQDGLLAAWRNLRKVREPQALKHWIYTIAVCHIRRTYGAVLSGRRLQDISPLMEDPAIGPLDALLDSEQQEFMDELIAELSPRRLEAITNHLQEIPNSSSQIKAKHHAILQMRRAVKEAA